MQLYTVVARVLTGVTIRREPLHHVRRQPWYRIVSGKGVDQQLFGCMVRRDQQLQLQRAR